MMKLSMSYDMDNFYYRRKIYLSISKGVNICFCGIMLLVFKWRKVMNLDKIINELAEEYTAKSVHASKEEVMKILKDAEAIIKKNKDATPEEIVDAIIDDCAIELNEILQNASTPGIMSSLQVDNINVNLRGGLIRPNGDKLTKDALFDVASITKFYTEIVAYKLINDGVFKLNDKIRELDYRFENVGDLTVSDVLKFVTTFRTDGRIEDATTKEGAEEKLFGMQVVQRGEEYNYNDMGLMLMKEVMENVTGKSYAELFDEYIVKPYGLNDTHLIVPEKKLHLVTGTPNLDGSVNDLKANVMGGYSGHAGIRVTSDDLIKLGQAINKDFELKNGLYVPNEKMKVRSEKIGSAYVNPEIYVKKDGTEVSGKELSYFGGLAPAESVAAQGSTRVITRSSNFNGIDINSTALSNIAGMTDEQMFKAIEEENARRLANNPEAKLLNSNDLIKERQFDGQTFKMHDPRALMNEDKTIGNFLYKYDNEVNLKLLLLNKILKEYEHYYDDINIDRDITKKSFR